MSKHALVALQGTTASGAVNYLASYDFDADTWTMLTKPCDPNFTMHDITILHDQVNEVIYWIGTTTATLDGIMYKSTDYGASWEEVACTPFAHYTTRGVDPQFGISEFTSRIYGWGLDGAKPKLGYYENDTWTITDSINTILGVTAMQENSPMPSPITKEKLWFYVSSTHLLYNPNSGTSADWVNYNLGQTFSSIIPSKHDDTVLYGVYQNKVFKLTGNGAAITTLATVTGGHFNAIWEDAADKNKLYILDGGVTAKMPAWYSEDGGVTWNAATGDITAGNVYAGKQIIGRYGYGNVHLAMIYASSGAEARKVRLAWTTDGKAWTASSIITGVADWAKVDLPGPVTGINTLRITYSDPVVSGPVSHPEPEPPTEIPDDPVEPDEPDPPDPIYTEVERPDGTETLLVYDEGKNGWMVYDNLPGTAVSWDADRRHIILAGDAVDDDGNDVLALAGLFRYGLDTPMQLIFSFHGLNDVFKYKRVRHVEIQTKADAKEIGVYWEFDGNEVGGRAKVVNTAKGVVFGSSVATDNVGYWSSDKTGGTFSRPLEKKYRYVCPEGGMGTLARLRIETEGEGEVTIERVTINFVMAP